MATLRTLIQGELPPVGQRVLTDVAPKPPPEFPGFRAAWTASGTMALALAVCAARALRRDVDNPKVLLPAYGCPDLAAAVLYAGGTPVVVDLEQDGPGFDAEALRNALGSDVVAIVAVNFLGIREDLTLVNRLAAACGAVSIEDCAQWYPEEKLVTDAVVLSFGRGKPVNLLGGGGLLYGPRLAPVEHARLNPSRARTVGLRARAFNALTCRVPYAWVSRLPLLAVGETRYQPVSGLAGLGEAKLGRLRASADAWLRRDRWRERFLDEALTPIAGVDSLPVTLDARRGRLLRYPVLLPDAGVRDRALAELNGRGLGASSFYSHALLDIARIPRVILAHDSCPSARSFARRLLTLPLHDRVTRRDLERIVATLHAICRPRDRVV